jgi:hypothetical protein
MECLLLPLLVCCVKTAHGGQACRNRCIELHGVSAVAAVGLLRTDRSKKVVVAGRGALSCLLAIICWKQTAINSSQQHPASHAQGRPATHRCIYLDAQQLRSAVDVAGHLNP